MIAVTCIFILIAVVVIIGILTCKLTTYYLVMFSCDMIITTSGSYIFVRIYVAKSDFGLTIGLIMKRCNDNANLLQQQQQQTPITGNVCVTLLIPFVCM